MELRFKTFLIFFSLFNFALLENIDLEPNGEINKVDNKVSTNFTVTLTKTSDNYAEYINIILSADAKRNPILFISKDEKCEDRLYLGHQLVDPIYSFIKTSQISNKFYICIETRQNSELKSYNLTIRNEDKARLPYYGQGSYYVSDNSLTKMSFGISLDDNLYTNDNSKLSLWAKGKSITQTSLDDDGFIEHKYDNGIIYYGTFKKKSLTFEVQTEIGDYVTIGSVVVTDGKTLQMKENANEMVIVTEEQVCMPIIFGPEDTDNKLSQIAGRLYTRKGKVFFGDQDGKGISEEGITPETNITNGIIDEINMIKFLLPNLYNGTFCLAKPENNVAIFDIQMSCNRELPLVHAPLIPGEIKRHFLMKGESAIFYGMKPKDEATEVNLNLKTLKGFPEMYFDNCTTFPKCNYAEGAFSVLTNPAPSNMITVYSFYTNETAEYKEFNPISSFQPIMIVYCGEGGKSEILGESSICIFDTSYFTNLDTIHIYEESTFSQYLLAGEDDKYKINLEGENSTILYLDMMLFSGDADFIISNFRGEGNKYYLSNKVFYSVHLDNFDSLEFSVKASRNCFYMIQYQFIKVGGENDANTIESGVNYITSKFIDEKNTNPVKFINLMNFKYEHKQPYLMTFYSPNCKFDLNLINGNEDIVISKNDNVVQKIINSNESYYGKEYFPLKYEVIKEVDESQIAQQYCMVYTSGLEISNSINEWNGRSISLSEGVPHRYTFSNQYSYIFYAYHVSDQEKTLVLNFKLIDKNYFDINIKINRVYLRNVSIYRNSQIYIKKDDFVKRCEELEVCTVLVTVKMRESKIDRRMEFTMYQIDSTPLYLERNVVKQDIIHGDKFKHYYFEITDKEYGDITLDFKRGSGNIYACVENRTRADPMNQPDWRGLYHFPTTNEESLKFKTYGKKILISKEDTKKCSNGCYVLISIVSNSKYFGDYEDETVPFRISINPRVMKIEDNIQPPKVKIDVNEFVIGDLVYNLAPNRVYDYYTVTLPFESDYVYIDWQADSPLLLINVGDERPTKDTDKAHFSFPPIGKDFVYKLNKTDILKKGGYDSNTSLRGITLTIGIYSETNDSIQSSPYAFKIFLPLIADQESKTAAEIIHIRSDQKVQCLPFVFTNNSYVCMFAVIIDDVDATRNLVVYPRNQHGSKMNIYGTLAPAEFIERNDKGEIYNLMYNVYGNQSCKVEERYVFIEDLSRNYSYFFMISAEDNSESIMEVMSSTQVFYEDVEIYPNPSTAQVFATNDKRAHLNFITTQDLLLNLVSLAGIGGFHWSDLSGEQNMYYLNGYNDRLSLTTSTNDMETRFAPLEITSSNFVNHEKGKFVFYITYYPRNNIDQLKTNRNTEFHYRTVKMPLYYYAPIARLQDYTINFNFYDFLTKNNENVVYDTNLFNIWATVISENDANKARTDFNYLPTIPDENKIKGTFDSAFGYIFFSQIDIDRIYKNTDQKETPAIYFALDLSEGIKYEFTSLGFEVNIYSSLKSMGVGSSPEGIYISGKLSQSEDKRLVYSIPCIKEKPWVKVEYAANSDLVKFALSANQESDVTDNFKDKTEVEKCGRKILRIKLEDKAFSSPNSTIYFIIYTKEKNINNKLDYFTFKYVTDNSTAGDIDFLDEKDRDLTYEVKDNKYTLKFTPMKFTGVSYFIKAVYKDELIEGEKKDTIAMSESKGKYMQITNLTYNQNEKTEISLEIDNNRNISYIKVMARLNLYDEKIFYLYKPAEPGNTKKDEPEKEKNNTLLYVSIAVGGTLFVVALILVVFIFIYKKKNKDLVEQVNKISFVQSGAETKEKEKGKDDGNLLLDGDD